MPQPVNMVMGGDPFSDVFRGTYDPHSFWNLTDPDYCVSVMRSAYDAGCRAYELSFAPVQDMFIKLRDSVDEEIIGYANPTYLQGVKLDGKPLQFCRNRILKTFADREGFISPEFSERLKNELRENYSMMFGYDPNAQPLSDSENSAITLDEDAFKKRLDELGEASCVLVGGTDADWLFTLGRADIIVRMVEIVRDRGQSPFLICHYASRVLPEADRIGLDVDGYFAPINKSWGWFSLEEASKAVREAKKPVTAFMAFACGGLVGSMREAAEFLRDDCGVSGIMFGTTKIKNARSTAELIKDIYR